MYLVKSPLLLKWLYPSLVWNKSRSEKIVYLTFDDGPLPNVTTFVLNTLKNYHIKATFFCIGDNISKHPEVFEQVKNDGHSIGNHTYNHLNGWKTDDKTYLENFLKCQQLTQTNLFRPPYGRIKKSQVRGLKWKVESQKWKVKSGKWKVESKALELDPQLATHNSQLNIIMWDVLSGDFDSKISPEKCLQNVIKNTENGSIIVFHDSLKAFDRLAYALPKTIEHLLAKGYAFGVL
jgi:peptidoglycan/xylan/chitin deacetylase (PgdA/CDA1 family)